MAICSLTIHLVIVNLYTKFEVSILNSCGDILDEKIWRERKKSTYREEEIGEGPFSFQPIKLVIVNLYTKGLGSIRGVFGPMSKISFTLSNYRFVIWDKNYRRYFVIYGTFP